MSFNHININQLTNLEANYYLGVKARACAQRMKIGKDKVYRYYKLFMQGLTVQEIYNQYLINKSRCGRKPIVLSKEKLDDINNKLENDWSLDAIAGRDKIDGKDEKISTKTLYKLAKQGVIDINKLRRKGKNNPKGHNETRGKINTCKTIHERDEKYPNAKTSIEYGHFEGDTIVGKARKSAIVTLVEKYSKYIVLSIITPFDILRFSNFPLLKKQFANGYHLYISRVYLLLHLIEVKSFQNGQI